MSVVNPTESTPKRHLHLVANNDAEPVYDVRSSGGSRPDHSGRARHVAQLDPDARRLRNDVLRSALASGVGINPDAVSAIFATKAHHSGPLRYFTEDTVWDLIWFDISHWCGTRGIDLPEGMHRALWFVLGYLAESGELHPNSDDLDDLRSPLFSSAGLDYGGEPRFRD